MPIKLSIDETLDEARREIRDFSDRQVPFAIKAALNRTAEAGKARARKEMEKVFDQPKPFTLNSLYILKASKSSLQSAVGIKDAGAKGTPAAQYLAAQITGGDRLSKPFERALQSFGAGNNQAVPGRVPLDKYGNVTRGRVNTMLNRLRGEAAPKTRNKESYFVGRPEDQPNAPEGVWVREKSRLVPALVFVRKVKYRPRFAFADVIRATVEDEFNDHFAKELHNAHATRKR